MSASPAPPTAPRPDASELWSLAETLGIDLPQEKHLLHIVRSAMKSELPPNWSAHQTTLPDGSTAPFYFNAKSGQSRWMRPITAANHEALRVARAAGAGAGLTTVPSSSAATPATTPPHSSTQTPRGGPTAAAGSSSSTTAPASASSSSAIATAASTAARFLLSPPSTASSGSATPNSSTPGRKSKQASIDTAAGFSLEIQKDILASFDGASLRCVQMVQRCFRKWRKRKQELIRAKIKVHRATMDADMMAKLAMGSSASKEKRRTTMEAGASLFLAQAAAAVNSAQQQQAQKPGLQLPTAARTTPSTPTRTPTGRQSPVSSSPPASSRGHSLNVPGSASSYAGMSPEEEAAARAAKKRASMLRMLNIQNRFRADGSVEVVAMPDSAPVAAPASSAAATSLSSSTPISTPSKVAFAAEADDEAGLSSAERRGGSRLNNRRRTFTQEDKEGQASSNSSSSSSSSSAQAATAPSAAASAAAAGGSPRTLRPSPSSAAAAALAASQNEALKSWRFLRLVIRAQKRFKAHRLAMRAKLAEKIAAQQRRQTMDTERKLRRASLPFSDLSAIRKRLSNQPAAAEANHDSSSK